MITLTIISLVYTFQIIQLNIFKYLKPLSFIVYQLSPKKTITMSFLITSSIGGTPFGSVIFTIILKEETYFPPFHLRLKCVICFDQWENNNHENNHARSIWCMGSSAFIMVPIIANTRRSQYEWCTGWWNSHPSWHQSPYLRSFSIYWERIYGNDTWRTSLNS